MVVGFHSTSYSRAGVSVVTGFIAFLGVCLLVCLISAFSRCRAVTILLQGVSVSAGVFVDVHNINIYIYTYIRTCC